MLRPARAVTSRGGVSVLRMGDVIDGGLSFKTSEEAARSVQVEPRTRNLSFIGLQAYRGPPSLARNVRVTVQRDEETLSADSQLKNKREEAKVARRIAPSLYSGSLVSAVLLSDIKNSTLLFY